MNPKVPRGAAVLLDYIGGLETARKDPASYRTVIGHLDEQAGVLLKPITEMTLNELLAEQTRWVRKFKKPSGAAGRYQIIRPTLLSLMKELGVPGTAKFTPDLQDAMGFALLERRGYARFMAAQLPLKAYGNELAKEWASLPVLAPIRRGGKNPRTLQRGQSYYAGDGINKSLDSAMDFESVLAEALNEGRRGAGVEKPPAPTGDMPVKGDMDNEIVAQVQRRLRELGFTEVGNVDGDFGDLTEDTIILFQKYNDLPRTGQIDHGLLVALAKAQPRVISSKREDATLEEVRERVPEAKAGWLTQVLGFFGMIGTALIGFAKWAMESVSDIREAAQPVLDVMGYLPWYGYVGIFSAVAAFIYFNGRKSVLASAAAYRTGERR